MPGWGKSTSRHVNADYAQEALVEGMLALLSATGRSAAVWVGHDWASAVASSLAAHHPSVIQALVLLAIPYKTIELGLHHIVSLVDRKIYPKHEYPFGQWDYMAYYEESFEEAIADFDANIPGLLKFAYAPPPPGGYSFDDAFKPSFTASVRKNGGLFGGGPAPPAETLPAPLLDAEVFDVLVEETEETGLWGGTAYYTNHKANARYNSHAPHGGRLGRDKPVLFIHAKFDFVAASLTTRFAEPMREACENLTEVVIGAAHFVQSEKPEEVNAAVVKFLVEKVKECWPGADSDYHHAKA
ncbi:hypothetical protein Daus18300_007580 [Diaporthe australafricana]|uniref:AB hydrolase-1 domain-containing protein n=1 Tax=Diaporthe australafricana TaxID=127596 RepID=A0ABR3WLQ4_9PEZI